jgi:hypothetical protein
MNNALTLRHAHTVPAILANAGENAATKFLAVLGMRVSDFYENGGRRWLRLLEKGGKHHEVPVHHKALDYVAEYLGKAGFEPKTLPTVHGIKGTAIIVPI